MVVKKKREQKEGKWETISNDNHPYSHKGAFPDDSSKLQRRVAANPLAALFECAEQVQRNEATFRNGLYDGLQFGYAIARHMSMDFKAFKEFYKLEFFEKGKRRMKPVKQHKNALRHVMNFVFNATCATKRKRTGKYAAALDGYMKMGMPAHMVADQIRADGGIERLYEISLERAAERPKRPSPMSTMPAGYMIIDDEPVFLEGKAAKTPAKDWSLDDLDEDPNPAGREGETDAAASGGPKPTAIEGEREVLVKLGQDPSGREVIMLEATPGMKKRLLSVKAGQMAMVRLVGMGVEEGDDPDKGWVRLRARRAFRWPTGRAKVPVH